MGLWCKIIWPHCNCITLEKMENMEPEDITMQITSFKLLKMLSAIPHFWSAMTFVEDPQDRQRQLLSCHPTPAFPGGICVHHFNYEHCHIFIRLWCSIKTFANKKECKHNKTWFECLNILLPGKKESMFRKLHSLNAKKTCRDLDIKIYSQIFIFWHSSGK